MHLRWGGLTCDVKKFWSQKSFTCACHGWRIMEIFLEMMAQQQKNCVSHSRRRLNSKFHCRTRVCSAGWLCKQRRRARKILFHFYGVMMDTTCYFIILPSRSIAFTPLFSLSFFIIIECSIASSQKADSFVRARKNARFSNNAECKWTRANMKAAHKKCSLCYVAHQLRQARWERPWRAAAARKIFLEIEFFFVSSYAAREPTKKCRNCRCVECVLMRMEADRYMTHKRSPVRKY